jgi:hypothetical protein
MVFPKRLSSSNIKLDARIDWSGNQAKEPCRAIQFAYTASLIALLFAWRSTQIILSQNIMSILFRNPAAAMGSAISPRDRGNSTRLILCNTAPRPLQLA